jgi:transposase
MKAYSQDLRERVLRAEDQGYPRAQIVKMFGLSLAALQAVTQRETTALEDHSE